MGGGEPNGGIAAALSGAIGQGLAANVMPAGMNGTSGGDAMQQMAAGVAMNYLGGIKNYGEQTAVTYTGSTLAVLRYYFQVLRRRHSPAVGSISLRSTTTLPYPPWASCALDLRSPLNTITGLP